MNYDAYQVETMTLNEVARLFRALGIPTTETKIALGIEQGVYPFGVCIQGGERRQFEIYRRKVDEWLLERAVPRGVSGNEIRKTGEQ